MTRLLIAAFCSIWMASAAADALPQAASSPAAQQQQPVNAPAETPPASAVEGTQPDVQGGEVLEPKSAIPIDKRKGGDITKCLEDGNRTDQEIAACAEPYSPLHQHHPQHNKKNKKNK